MILKLLVCTKFSSHRSFIIYNFNEKKNQHFFHREHLVKSQTCVQIIFTSSIYSWIIICHSSLWSKLSLFHVLKVMPTEYFMMIAKVEVFKKECWAALWNIIGKVMCCEHGEVSMPGLWSLSYEYTQSRYCPWIFAVRGPTRRSRWSLVLIW